MKNKGKLALRELAPILADYENYLSSWSKQGKDTLFRVEGPIAQKVWLDRLRTGEYRPTFSIRVLTAQSSIRSSELCQFLSIKYQVISLKLHSNKFDEIKQTISEEIYPKVNKPLDPRMIYKEYEKRAVPKLYESYSLASLAAYLDLKKKAFQHIKIFRELSVRFLEPSNPIFSEYHGFIDKLELWIEKNDAFKQLSLVIQQEIENI